MGKSRTKPPSDEANIREAITPEAEKAVHNPVDRERLIMHAAALLGKGVTAARKSPQAFIQFALRTPDLRPIVLEPFHRFWLDRFQQSSRVQIEASKAHGKTTNVVGFLTWQIGKKPDLRAKLFAQSASKARQRLQVVGNLIKNNKLARLAFPHLKPSKDGPWHKEAIQVARDNTDEKEPTLEAKGIMGSVEGGRADLVLLDDVCVVGSTPIITKRGTLPMKDVIVGDVVLNHEGTWSVVKHKHIRHTNTLLKMHVQGLPDPVVCTPNHPLLMSQEQKTIYSKDLPQPSFIRADAVVIGKATRRWFMAFPIHGDTTILPSDLHSIWSDFELPIGSPSQHTDKIRNLSMHPLEAPAFWFMVGYWLANGWVNKEGAANPGQVWLSIPHKKEYLTDVFRDTCATLLQRSMTKHPEGKKKARRCVVSDVALAKFLGTFRHKDYTKEFPAWVYDLPKPLLRQMIAGFFTGDGSRGPKDRYCVASVSLNLLFQMQHLLARFGVMAQMSKGRMHKLSTKPGYEMSMSASFGAYILESGEVPGKVAWSILENGHLFRPIRKVEMIQEETRVYTLTMTDDTVHSYQGPLCVSQNCDYRSSLVYPQFRESIKNKLFAEILPMLDDRGRAISIATPHHECLHPATRVLTAQGRKPACELTQDDSLWIAPGQYDKPLQITKRPSYQAMYKLTFVGHSEPQLLTGNHRVPTRSGLKYVKDLQLEDSLPIEGYNGTRIGTFAPHLIEWLSSRPDNLLEEAALPAFFEMVPSSCLFSLFATFASHNTNLDVNTILSGSLDMVTDWQRVMVGLGIPYKVLKGDGQTYRLVPWPIDENPLIEITSEAKRLWLPIQSIERTDYTGPVYDIATSSGYFSLDAVKVHNSDAVAALRGNRQWECYQFPVGTEEDPYKPLWEAKWPRKSLIAKCEEIGQMEYDRAYRLKEITLGFRMITGDHIKYYTAEDLGDPYALVCVQAYDLAISKKKGASFFAAVTLLYKPNGRMIFVADAWHDKLDLHQQAAAVLAEYVKWDADAIYVEETGYQQALRNYVTDKAAMLPKTKGKIIPIHGVSPGSKSKELRLMETMPAFQAGRILFNPRLDPVRNPQVNTRGDLIQQLVDFHKARDRDLADAFGHAVKGAETFASLADEDDYTDEEWDEGDNIATRLLIV